MRWCQGVPQARTRWRVPVAGAPSRAWRRAVGQRTSEGQKSLSFLRPPLGRSRRAPVAAMCSLWLGGFGPAGGGCPPASCAGHGSAAGSLGRVSVACGPLNSGLAADPWGGGGGRAVCSAHRPAGVRVKRCLPLALDRRENGGDVRLFGAGPLGPASGIGGR